MNALVVFALIVSAVMSATGMVLFRYGGRGNTTIAEFLNVWILIGCVCYLLGAVAALYSLSKVSATTVYPFTVLQAVLIFFYSAVFLGEKLTAGSIAGCVLVLAGLFFVTQSSS